MDQANKRIFKNTIALYIRQMFVLFISLYTSRIVLDVLGVVDFGIYNVVAGVVGMMAFFNGMMGAATSRFFTFGLGKSNLIYLNKIVGTTFLIYVFFIILVFILAETIGIWFLENKLIIPDDRMSAARIIYQFAIGTFLCSLLSVPFISMITAHESMKVYAYVGILEVVMRLGIVFAISYISFDKLAAYGGLMMLSSLIILVIYFIYCKKNYEECKLHFYFEKNLFKEILSFSGWSLFGASVGVARGAITNILLNMFFGPVVNAARAVANQISNGVSSFSNSFFTAVRPQIIKNYASDNLNRMTFLMEQSAKGAFFLMLLFALPIILETPYILKLWLKNPPDGAIIFSQLVLIELLIDSINLPIITAANATGKIKLYQSVVGGILLLCAPISYVVLKMGAPAYSVMLVMIGTIIMATIARLYLTTRILDFKPFKFLKEVLPSVIFVTILSAALSYTTQQLLTEGLLRLIAVVFVSSISTITFALFFGVKKEIRFQILSTIKKRLNFNK